VFPVGDEVRRRQEPVVTYAIMAACAAAFLYTLYRGYDAMIDSYGFRPLYLFTGERLYTILTCMLLHADPWHIAGNMLYLFAFGRSVEDRLGPLRYTMLFLLSGVAGSIVHAASLVILPGAEFLEALATPLVGSSGAISGVLGAHAAMFPGTRVKTGVLVVYYVVFIMVPAKYYVLFWFLYQVALALTSLRVPAPVAVWAHIGGFAVGAALSRLFKA